MRDDELRLWLRQRNPWWRPSDDRTAWVRHDPTLQGALALGLDYQPPVLAGVFDGGLYVIRGPRRVGKSVALKRFVTELLGRPDVRPAQVIYLSLDEFDQRSLRRALHLARDLTAPAADAPRYWLIDEVTAVAGWPAVIKAARDDTPFAFDTVVLTG
ncbi:MAG: ATP-binding protein, partial [Acidimicrobiales bacterium]